MHIPQFSAILWPLVSGVRITLTLMVFVGTVWLATGKAMLGEKMPGGL